MLRRAGSDALRAVTDLHVNWGSQGSSGQISRFSPLRDVYFSTYARYRPYLSLEDRVELGLNRGLIVEELLQLLAFLELFLSQPQQLQRLVVLDEATLDSKALFSDLFPDHVEAIHFRLFALLVPPHLLR